MTFAQRQIDVRFTLQDGAFPGGSKTLKLIGHMVQATLSASQGAGSTAYYYTHLRIFGMKMADMSALCTWNNARVSVNNTRVDVFAGDVGSPLHSVFAGTVFTANVEINEAESALVVYAEGPLWERCKPAAPNTHPGTQDVASIIGGLATQAGFGFKNHGVTAKISGQYLPGTVMDQIERIATATQTMVFLDALRVLHIWPSDGEPEFPVVKVGPGKGMVGYPRFTAGGIDVLALWNPLFLFGTLVEVESLIPMASGRWRANMVQHEISTMVPDGPWYTHLSLQNREFRNARSN